MLKQIVNGRNVKTVNVFGSTADITTLSAVLVGKIEVYENVGEGGTSATVPELNYMGMAFGHKGLHSRKSCSVFFPHIKVTKTASEVATATKGIWNADFITAQKSSYVNAYSLKSEV